MDPNCVFNGFNLVCKDMYVAEVVMCIVIVLSLLALMETAALFNTRHNIGVLTVILGLLVAFLYLVFSMLGAV